MLATYEQVRLNGTPTMSLFQFGKITFPFLFQKIRKMRKAGLEKAGELSDENLVYKLLRNEGILQKLFDLLFIQILNRRSKTMKN